MSTIVEDATQTISKLGKLDKQTKTVFKPNYIQRIVSSFFIQNLQGKLPLKTHNVKGIPLLSRNLKIQ